MTENEKLETENKETQMNYKSHAGLIIIIIVIGLILIAGVGAAAFGFSRKFGNNRMGKNEIRNVGIMNKGMRGFDRQGFDANENFSGFRISGEITKIDNNNLTVKTANQDVAVVISTTTSIRNGHNIAKQSDLKVNNNITVLGPSNSDGIVQAQLIVIK